MKKFNLKSTLTVTSLFLLISLFFNNCGQQGDIALSSTQLTASASGTPGTAGGYPTTTLIEMTKSVNIAAQNKVDILIIDDNSGSMNSYQSSLASRFSSFLTKIQGLHWQLGITTTDVNSPTSLGYSDGQLIHFDTSHAILNDSMSASSVQSLFNQAIVRPESSDSTTYKYTQCEQGIKGTYRALERALTPQSAADADNKALIRPDASLAVIIVSNSNESTNVTDSRSCSNAPEMRNSPENLQKMVAANFPGKAFSFHSIIVKSGDSTCLGKNGNEFYGAAYQTLSGLTNGVVSSICTTDYGAQLGDIGLQVSNIAKQITLDCDPVGSVVVLDNAQQIPATDYIVSGRSISFANPLTAGTVTVNYKCAK